MRFVYRSAVTRDIRRDPDVRDVLLGYADDVRAKAQNVAPYRTGLYRSTIYSEVDSGPEGHVGRVTAPAPYAVFIEFGTGEPGPTPQFAPLRRGLFELRRTLL